MSDSPTPEMPPIMAAVAAERAATETVTVGLPDPDPGVLGYTVETVEHDEHEHVEGIGLANEVVITRHGDGMIELTIDGENFPWFVSREPGVQIIRPTEEMPVPILLVPVLAGSIEVRDAVPADLADANDAPGDEEQYVAGDEECPCCDGEWDDEEPSALEGVVVVHPEGDATP